MKPFDKWVIGGIIVGAIAYIAYIVSKTDTHDVSIPGAILFLAMVIGFIGGGYYLIRLADSKTEEANGIELIGALLFAFGIWFVMGVAFQKESSEFTRHLPQPVKEKDPDPPVLLSVPAVDSLALTIDQEPDEETKALISRSDKPVLVIFLEFPVMKNDVTKTPKILLPTKSHGKAWYEIPATNGPMVKSRASSF